MSASKCAVLVAIVLGGGLGCLPSRPSSRAVAPGPAGGAIPPAGSQAPPQAPATPGPPAFPSSVLPPAPIPPPPPGYYDEKPAGIDAAETTAVVGQTLYALGAYRGLHVVALGAEPSLISRVPIPGVPHALFVAGSVAYAVMGASVGVPHSCSSCPEVVQAAAATLVVAVDVANPVSPRIRATLRLDGDVAGARLEGTELTLVLRQLPRDRGGTAVVAVDLANPEALRERGRVTIPGPSWVDEVQFASGTVYLGLYGGQFWADDRCQPLGGYQLPSGVESCSRLLAVDLATLKAGASLELAGRVDPGGSDHDKGTLRVFARSSIAGPGGARLVTVATPNAAEMTPLATLPLPRGGIPRFEGDRMYVVTGDPQSPLLIVDLSRPAGPALGSAPPTVGSVSRIVTAEAGRLITAGTERSASPCAKAELAVLDVTNVDRPRLLAQETTVAGFSERLPVAVAGGLLAYAFRMQAPADLPSSARSPVSVQLFDLDPTGGTLKRRGQALLGGGALRLVPAGDHLLALNSETLTVPPTAPQQLEILDLRDRDRPSLRKSIELSRPVTDLVLAGGAAVELVFDDEQGRFILHLVPDTDPDGGPATSTLTFHGLPGSLFADDRFVYLFWLLDGAEPRLEVLEVSGDQLRRRGWLSLNGADQVSLGVDTDGRVEPPVKQLGGTTFLVPVRPSGNCGPGPQPVAGTSSCSAGHAPILASLPDQMTPVPTVPQPSPAPACPGNEYGFLVIDASAPDQPRMASSLRLGGNSYVEARIGRDRRVFLSRWEWDPNLGPDGRVVSRYSVSEVDLTDVDRPAFSPPVSAPGLLIAERPEDRTWFTVDTDHARALRPGSVRVSAFVAGASPPSASGQRHLRLDGYISGPVTDENAAYFTVNGELVVVGLRGPDAPLVLSRMPVPGATISGSVQGETPGPGGDGHRKPVAADVHRVAGGHVTVALQEQFPSGLHMAVLVYDVRDPTRPRLLDRAAISLWRRPPVRLAPGNRLLIPRRDSGVEVVNLAP